MPTFGFKNRLQLGSDQGRSRTKPYGIAYDALSGNLIVAMGLQGVVVGSPDGHWSRVAVGDYSPTDFSFAGKTVVLLSNLMLWVTTICLSAWR